MIDRPVFLVGAERSGTTLLRLMLSHHPRISFASESEYLVRDVKDDGTLPSREVFAATLMRDRGFINQKRQIQPDLDVIGLANDVVRQAAHGREVAVYGATVHHHFNRLRYIWPEARYIHLVRDGRDVALSAIPMGWAGNLYHGIDRWIEAEAIWERMERELPSDRYIVVKFEDLISDAVRELTRICHFVGLDYDPGMLAYDKSSTYSKPSASNKQKWTGLDPRLIAETESRAEHWLTRNGYALSGEPRRPGAARKAYYRLHDRWVKMRFAQKRLTLGLWLERLVAYRIGGKKWREKVRLAEHAVINRHIK